MVNLNQLEVLVAVSETGGFSGAAKQLYMSQPSVSNHIRNLEGSLGVQLVRRSTRGARPTPAGEMVVDHARQIFQLLHTIEQEVASHRGLRTGRLVVAGTTTLGTYLLPPMIGEFARRAPKVECQLRVGNEDAVEEWLVKGEVALGLCIDVPSEEQLVAEPLFEERMVLVAGPDSPLKDRPVSSSDLVDTRFLMREMGSATRRLQETVLRDWDLATVDQWDVWGADTLKEAAVAGLGIALVSEHAVAQELDTGRLIRLSTSLATPGRTVSLVRRADRVMTPPEEAFAMLVRGLGAWPRQGSD